MTIGRRYRYSASPLPRRIKGNSHFNKARPSANRIRYLRIQNTGKAFIDYGRKPNCFSITSRYKSRTKNIHGKRNILNSNNGLQNIRCFAITSSRLCEVISRFAIKRNYFGDISLKNRRLNIINIRYGNPAINRRRRSKSYIHSFGFTNGDLTTSKLGGYCRVKSRNIKSNI